MSKPGDPVTEAAGMVSRAEYDTAIERVRAEGHAAGHDAGLTSGRREGIAGERIRVGAIMGSEPATGREALARHFAFETDMSADAATAALKVSPKAEAAKLSRLAGTPVPQVEAVDHASPPQSASADLAGGMVKFLESRGLKPLH